MEGQPGRLGIVVALGPARYRAVTRVRCLGHVIQVDNCWRAAHRSQAQYPATIRRSRTAFRGYLPALTIVTSTRFTHHPAPPNCANGPQASPPAKLHSGDSGRIRYRPSIHLQQRSPNGTSM